MHICVLGAGVIGVTTSYSLLAAGHEVTLVDAMDDAGLGASYGNGAQLSYSYVAPLADPSVWTKWPHYLFGRNSPLAVKPTTELAQWTWLAHFLQACNAECVRQTTVSLLRLAFLSRDEMARLRAAVPLRFQHRTSGKLVMYTEKSSLDAARRQVAIQARHGCHQEILGADECIRLEPALGASQRDWAGGVYTADEEVGDCALFCQELLNELRKNARFSFQSGTTVTGASVRNGRLAAVEINRKGKLDADAFVLTMGARSAGFARQAGFSLPVYPLKGYSITVPVAGLSVSEVPSISITDFSRKVVYARIGDDLRVAGRVELVGFDKHIPARAIEELKTSTGELFPHAADRVVSTALSPWTGFRPATPTGLPIIGPSPLKGLYLNVGHGSLGWTLACGSASLLAQQIGGDTTVLDTRAFQLAA
ncbi:D-amino acid dehydrogenase [Noviherbaspirillum saxi]|uniref:D-amino acid dehydrogenase n=1 Tax=Noviherbaspirillum saxi TaxID=2320863 RepID=A0A3A3FX54_9BURK|nr:D-amino acid dehydrogenase [Noviherbaspirillum saxi]RJF91649.1 D-amino acid dehydrogenase [Noviherbaspirillum saxi]